MNLAWHHFKKDVRQFRLFLAIWFGLLLLDLAVNLGWVGRVEYSPVYGFSLAANTWTTILPGVVWALVGLLPSLVVLADSPALREGFLATRPLPKGDLLLAKIIFVLALIVAPWVLQELVHLKLQGMPHWVIHRGALERLLFALPVAVGCAAFAALWPSHARWVRAIGIVAAGFGIVSAVVSLCAYWFHFYLMRFVTGNPGNGVAGVYGFTLALVGLAVWHSRAHRGWLGRWGGLILAYVLSQWASSLWPWEDFKLQPVNQSAANAVMARSGFEIPAHAIILQKEQASERSSKPKFSISVSAKTKVLPAHSVVEWSGKDAKLLRADGGELQGDGKIFHSELFTMNYWNNAYNLTDYAAWSGELSEDVLFHQGSFGTVNTSSSLYLGRFDLPATRAELTGPLTLQASLEARVFQWRKLAEMPLTPGATATDEFGSWKFVAIKQLQPATSEVYLERRQISLSTAGDARCSRKYSGPLARMVWMVYDPVSHVAWMPDQSVFRSAERGTHTALAQYFITLSFYNQHRIFTAEELVRCRLVVFEKSWLGSVPEPWQSAAFKLDEKIQPFFTGNRGNSEPMPQAEFNRRMAALPVPAPEASRHEVSLYLLEFLRLVDARRYPLQTSDPLTAQLARFVPTQLPLLLDGLPAMDSAAKQTVLHAIQLGVTDGQKPDLIAALSREPELASVLLARDWVEDARPEIYGLVKLSRRLPSDALRAIAWFHDPQTYPRLLEAFEAEPSVSLDDLLRPLPGLAPELDAIAARSWREEKLVLREPGGQMFGEMFNLAMRRGDVSALQRVYQMLDDPGDSRLNYALNMGIPLPDTIQMPGLRPEDRQDYNVVFAWMRKHRPEDFVFSPARRQFVLKQTP